MRRLILNISEATSFTVKLKFIVILLCINSLSGIAQQKNGQRNVTISYPDSVIKTSVLDKPLKNGVSDNYTYYWYYAGTINQNQGGYSGKLINGRFEVFDNHQKLLSQGNFRFGLKYGNWIRWYEDGTLKQSCSFKNGQMDGSLKSYDNSGHLLSDLNYKNNKLDGKAEYFLKDTVVIKKFRMGKDLTVKEPKKLFSKSKMDKQKHDSEILPAEKSQKGSIKRSPFSPFKKHDSEIKDEEYSDKKSK